MRLKLYAGRHADDNCGAVGVDLVNDTLHWTTLAGQLHHDPNVHCDRRRWQQTTAVQTITIEDTTAPEFVYVPADATVECSDQELLAALYADEAVATDNCGEFSIEMVQDSASAEGSGLGEYTITRTFTVTDDAGNNTVAAQTITVIDTTAPEFTYVPADATYQCSEFDAD